MTSIDSEKTTKIKLDVPFRTNGKVLQGEVTVPMSVAEDLERRQHAYREDKEARLRNNGSTIEADGSTIVF